MTVHWKEGDVVRLKSGGPKMVVDRVKYCSDDSASVYCVWFVGSEKRNAIFLPTPSDAYGMLRSAGETLPSACNRNDNVLKFEAHSPCGCPLLAHSRHHVALSMSAFEGEADIPNTLLMFANDQSGHPSESTVALASRASGGSLGELLPRRSLSEWTRLVHDFLRGGASIVLSPLNTSAASRVTRAR